MPRKMTRFVWVVFILLDLKSNSRGWKVRLQYRLRLRGKDRGGGIDKRGLRNIGGWRGRDEKEVILGMVKVYNLSMSYRLLRRTALLLPHLGQHQPCQTQPGPRGAVSLPQQGAPAGLPRWHTVALLQPRGQHDRGLVYVRTKATRHCSRIWCTSMGQW